MTDANAFADFLAAADALLGPGHLLTEPAAQAPYLTDWRGRYTGRALAVACPANTEEVAALVALCARHQVPIVPQGGNTGACGGSVPDASGTQLVLSLRRLNAIRAVDADNLTITVEAGAVLADVQQAAAAAGLLFPLSLGAEGSCTIGGNLATNAGGTAVLRYGNARELCLGLEVVTADGEIWNGLRGLRKDNTGYDLRDLFVGAEGTLGIITAAVLKLYPQPAAQRTALAAVASAEAALALLALTRRLAGDALTGFELISDACLQLVTREFPSLAYPFATCQPHAVLIELSDSDSDAHAQQRLETVLGQALEHGLVADAIVATSLSQSQTLWQLREHIPLAQARDGKNIKHDIALPTSALPAFVKAADAAVTQAFPGARLITFGHLGDGNLHYNVAAPAGADADAFLANQDAVNRIVYDLVAAHDGSISAEHGVGQLKIDTLPRYKSAVELALMKKIKAALDPQNLMNPGKVLRG